MRPTELRTLVNAANVDTFVCLQTSYTEYGCNDYRTTMRQLSLRNGVRFLHCPVPDFGVLDDASLMALVAELQVPKLVGIGKSCYSFMPDSQTPTLFNLLAA